LGSRRKGIAPLLNYEELRDLINTLQAGLEAGFNTTTSPLIPALDALIDMNLAMAERFRPRRGIKLKPWQLIEPPIRMYHDLNPEIHDTFEDISGNMVHLTMVQRPLRNGKFLILMISEISG
jgi:hypothetical protein